MIAAGEGGFDQGQGRGRPDGELGLQSLRRLGDRRAALAGRRDQAGIEVGGQERRRAKAGEVNESATEYLSRQQIEEQLARARVISRDGRPEFVILGTSTLVRLGFLAARSSLA